MTKTDIRQQTRQQRAMNLVITRVIFVWVHFQIALQHLQNLAVIVVPFAHSHIRQKIIRAVFAKFVI